MPELVREVDIRASRFLLRLSDRNPRTVAGAQGSLEFCSAVILKYGRLSSEGFMRECMEDPQIFELMSRITVTKDEEMQKYLEAHPDRFSAGAVIIDTSDGRKLEKFRPVPVGEAAGDRFGWEMLEEKYRTLVTDTPFEGKTEPAKRIRNLEKQQDPSFFLKEPL